jgi:glycerol kinase
MALHVLSLDQGTTSSRAMLFDHEGKIAGTAQYEFKQHFPKTGWVEHDPLDILTSQLNSAVDVLARARVRPRDIVALGITNQRETTIVWDRETGTPVYNAIVWQDRRTAEFCAQLQKDGNEDQIREKTGLLIDPYFSGTKVAWILDNVEGARARAEQGKLAFGTVDSWLIWNLTSGKRHITDRTNAARTLMYNIVENRWDKDLLKLLNVPESMMPEVVWSSEKVGRVSTSLGLGEIEIAGIAGDQQAALFGQACLTPGMAKNTYGTGCFLLMNTGAAARQSTQRLLTTVAWRLGTGLLQYALEGSVFVGGAAVQWLRDGLGMIPDSAAVEALARRVPDTGGVCFVPAFTGLGAPYWDPQARGALLGLTRGTTAAHIARASLEAIAFQSTDVLTAMHADSGHALRELRADGGGSRNSLLMQFQADLLGAPVVCAQHGESTVLGAACLAGIGVGLWSESEVGAGWRAGPEYLPRMSRDEAGSRLQRWALAVASTRSFQ